MRLIKKLKLPICLLKAVLQAEEPIGTQELVKFTWIHRLHSNKDRFALFKLAQEANLVPDCPVVKPTFMKHTCNALCPWFAPEGGWDSVYAAVPKSFAGYKCSFRVDSDGDDNFSFETNSEKEDWGLGDSDYEDDF